MEFKKMIKNSLYLFVGTMMTASMTGCNDDSNTSDSSSQEQILQSVITDYVDCTIIPTYRGMADASIELHNACLAMRNAGTGNVTTEMVQTAGNAWIKSSSNLVLLLSTVSTSIKTTRTATTSIFRQRCLVPLTTSITLL